MSASPVAPSPRLPLHLLFRATISISATFSPSDNLNCVGVEGYWTGLKQGIPLTSTGKQVATSLILVSPNETGNVGTDDFRIVIVDKQAGESTIYFAIYDSDGTVLRAFGVYSKTGNYQAAQAASCRTRTSAR